MKVINYTTMEEARVALKRVGPALREIEPLVNQIFSDIKENGDEAVLEYTSLYDRVKLDSLRVSDEEIAAAANQVPNVLKGAIQKAVDSIRTFHESQRCRCTVVETAPGVACWQQCVAIEKVGLYIPGGTAPLFSTVLMLAVPAQVAGCREVVLCTPPLKDGSVNRPILYAASITGVTKVFRVGGIQAIGAMAFGTESIPAVDKVFGPGNQYVTMAKQVATKEGVAIDIPAGPSAVMVVADNSAVPSFVASDMLSQAEHGNESQSVLVATSRKIANEVMDEINKQIRLLSRHDIAGAAMKNSVIVIARSLKDIMDIVNDYAPEHLILAVKNPRDYTGKIINAGSVFIGNYSPECAGDYTTGTNHTLPTNGLAKGWSGVSLLSFTKKITFQRITKEGLKDLGPVIMELANAEGLDGHANAVRIRMG